MPRRAAAAGALPHLSLLAAGIAAWPLAPSLALPPELALLRADVAGLDARADQFERLRALRAGSQMTSRTVGSKPSALPTQAASTEHRGAELPRSVPATAALLTDRFFHAGDNSNASSTAENNTGRDGWVRIAMFVAYGALDTCGLIFFGWFAWRACMPGPEEHEQDRNYRHGLCVLFVGFVVLLNLGVIQPMMQTLCVYAWLLLVAFFFASWYLRLKFGHTAKAIQAEVMAIGEGVKAIHNVVVFAESGLAAVEGRAAQRADDVLDALGLSEDSDEVPQVSPGGTRPAPRKSNWRCGC